MIKKTTKLRWRRRILSRKRRVEDIGTSADEKLEQHLIQRISRLAQVRRFISTWLLLLILLISGVVVQTRGLGQYYLEYVPVSGGTYTEGILGAFTNANPLYATSLADTSVSTLVFSGLFKFDSENELVGDLAQKWEVDATGLVYTVTLKPNTYWHDGIALTADDVVFTYQTIKIPDARSPLVTSWQGIEVAAKDKTTVIFTLPSNLASFPYSMTNGIVPKHILEHFPVSQLRTVAFNTANPIGSGPFKWRAIEVHGGTPENREEVIALSANEEYFGGEVMLSQFIIRTFRNDQRLVESLKNKELSAAVGLSSLSDEFAADSYHDYSVPLNAQVMVFLKNSQEILSDVRVRQALTKAINTYDVLAGLSYPAIVVRGPLLRHHIGYNPLLTQRTLDLDGANQLLDEAGWKMGADGIRTKEGKPLAFNIHSQSNSEYSYVAGQIQKQWRMVGVNAEPLLLPDSDFQSALAQHSYDALLYGIAVGNDPDVFPFWHSSQAEVTSTNRLNLSEYKSSLADAALEAGRTRTDSKLRSVKYKPFLDAWRKDAPAIALYQPRFLYVTYGQVHNLNFTVMNSSADRYANVINWMIREQRNIK